MTRNEILTRYRRLRQISNQHHGAVMEMIAPDHLMEWAKRLGMTVGGQVMLESDSELSLPEDLATYQPRFGRSHALERFARTAGFAAGSDEAAVLDAMLCARFSNWRIERWHEKAGLILRDQQRGGEVWLVDEALERYARKGVDLAARLIKPGDFAMIARTAVPVTPELMEEVFAKFPALTRIGGEGLAHDPRFVVAIYRAAIATGAMDNVQFRSRK